MTSAKANRTCIADGCDAPVRGRGKTGMCRPCAMAVKFADPDYRAKMRAGRERYRADPVVAAAQQAKLLEGAARYRANMTHEQRQAAREHGQWLYRTHASRPDVVERALSPEARKRGTAKSAEAAMAWCPLDRRAEYRRLRERHFSAPDARRIIEAEIPGTAEHARRVIASIELAARMRRERDQQDAY